MHRTSIGDLTGDILLNVFQYCTWTNDEYYSKKRIEKIARLQPIIAVCSIWRALALPTFYKSAVIEVRELFAEMYHTTSNFVFVRPMHQYLKTNIDLVVRQGRHDIVKELVICPTDISIAPVELIHTLMLYGFGTIPWQSIQKLRIEMSGLSHDDESDGGNGRGGGSADQEQGDRYSYGPQAMYILCHYLAKVLPNLKIIECKSYCKSTYKSFPFSVLISKSAHNLQFLRVYSDNIPKLNPDMGPLALTSLTLDIANLNLGLQLSKVFLADTLVRISLISVSPHQVWGIFKNSGSGKKIVFHNLERLTMTLPVERDIMSVNGTYINIWHDPGIEWPSFPCLHRLELKSSGIGTGSLLGLFPCSQITQLTLTTDRSGYLGVDMKTFTNIQVYRLLYLSDVRESRYSDGNRLCDIFKVDTQLQRLSLSCYSESLSKLPENFGCAQTLRILELETTISQDTLVYLISALQCLWRLDIWSLNYRDSRSSRDMVDFLISDGFDCTPINTTLRYFKLTRIEYPDSDNNGRANSILEQNRTQDSRIMLLHSLLSVIFRFPNLSTVWLPSDCSNEARVLVDKLKNAQAIPILFIEDVDIIDIV